jgi:hypothetical protein
VEVGCGVAPNDEVGDGVNVCVGVLVTCGVLVFVGVTLGVIIGAQPPLKTGLSQVIIGKSKSIHTQFPKFSVYAPTTPSQVVPETYAEPPKVLSWQKK